MTKRATPAVILACAALGAAALWWSTRPAPSPGRAPAADGGTAAGVPAAAPVPIIVYLIDTLRADRLGLYGYPAPNSPHIDALAAESVVFERAYGAAPWTLPSVASLLTSTWACEHGIVRYRQKLNPAVKTLAERLGPAGYDTAAYYSNIHAGTVASLNRGYRIAEERKSAQNDRAADIADFLGRRRADLPFYLYLHTMEPHEPFAAPARFVAATGHVSVEDRENYRALWFRHNELRSADWAARQPRGTTDNTAVQQTAMRYFADHRDQLGRLYDAAVRYADDNLGAAVRLLKERGLWDRAVFVLLADHGEEFGEHGGWFHDQSLYEELIHVPLLVHFPGGEFGGRRVTEPVSLVDVVPTLLDYLGRPDLCAGCRGTSLMPAIAGRTGPAGALRPGLFVPALRMNEIMYFRPVKERRGDLNVVVRQGAWKGIWNPEPGGIEIYDLAADPAERDDRSAREPALAAALRAEASRWLAACRAAGTPPIDVEELDEATRERLRAIGYLD